MSGTSRLAAVGRLAGMAGLLALLTAVLAAAEGITIPKGTAMELTFLDGLSTGSAKVGDKFRTRLVRDLYVDGQPTLSKGTEIEGRVVLVKSPRGGGALSGVIGVEFVSLQPAAGHAKDIHGKLTSLRQDDRRRMVELAPKVSTGRHIDVVFIGRSTAERESTLVGDDLAEAWSRSGLSASAVEIAAGTRVAMELGEAVSVPAAMGMADASDVRNIYVSSGTVAGAQQALGERKYYDGLADGQLSGPTRNAIIRFQLDHEQLATGDLDGETLQLLGLPPSSQR